MSKIVIRKKISLEFLGGDYKDAYLVFQSIPVKDFKEIEVKRKEIEDKSEEAPAFIIEVLQKYFVEGKFPGKDGLEDLNKEDLDGLDVEATIKCFELFTGQNPEQADPKDTATS